MEHELFVPDVPVLLPCNLYIEANLKKMLAQLSDVLHQQHAGANNFLLTVSTKKGVTESI